MRPITMAAKKSGAAGGGGGGGGGVTFSPVAGTYDANGQFTASFTVDASAAVVWSWTSTGNVPTSNVANGGTASSITFTLTSSAPAKATAITLTNGANTWNISLEVAP